MRFTRSFAKLVELSHQPEWHHKVWRDGGHYSARGDFREISGGELPVIIHHVNRHDRKAGDKIELVETGSLTLLEMKMIQEDVYDSPADENRVMRLDCAADLPGAPVQWFRNHTHVARKQTHREWGMQSLSGRRAETLYSGVKPNQIRIYDKTGHRAMLLQREIIKMPRESRAYAMTFEQRWGYPQSTVVTRVERQLGGLGPKRFGMHLVGDLGKLECVDPFLQIIFPGDWKAKKPVKFKAVDRIAGLHLAAMVKQDGLLHTQNFIFAEAGSRTQGYVLWNRFREYLTSIEAENTVTRKDLLSSFRTTIYEQFKLAA